MTSSFKQTFEEMIDMKGFCDFCLENCNNYYEHNETEKHIRLEDNFFSYDSKKYFERMLIDILLDDETVVFYPIPQIYISSHSFLIKRGIYQKFDFHYIKTHIQLNDISCKKKGIFRM